MDLKDSHRQILDYETKRRTGLKEIIYGRNLDYFFLTQDLQ